MNIFKEQDDKFQQLQNNAASKSAKKPNILNAQNTENQNVPNQNIG